jgi:lysophospholipase L1-like esterase
MDRNGRIIASTLVLLATIAACTGDAKAPAAPTSSTSHSAASTAIGSPNRPIGVIGIGHSWMTGYMSDPKSPGTDTEANSWATGTNPGVHSIYLRLVEAMPETAGNVVNAAHDGATSDLLPDQASEGLARVPYPALVIVQIVGNDLRCDGTDPEHYVEFRASVRQAVQTIVKASPKVSVVLVGDPGRPAGYAAAIATLPRTPKSFIDTRPCFLFSANRTVNRAEVARVTKLLAAYEAQLAKACAGIRQCHTDGGAAARMEVHVEDYGEDLQHPSIRGHAHIAAAEWPVIASVLGLG